MGHVGDTKQSIKWEEMPKREGKSKKREGMGNLIVRNIF